MTCLKQGIKAVQLTSVMRTFPDEGYVPGYLHVPTRLIPVSHRLRSVHEPHEHHLLRFWREFRSIFGFIENPYVTTEFPKMGDIWLLSGPSLIWGFAF